MANGLMSYTGRDITDIRQALVNKIPELTDKWRDFNESDLGITFIELIAGAQDMQNYYFDTQTFETYLDTAQQPKNVRALLRAMNYRIPITGAAKGIVQIQYKDRAIREVNIPKYFQFRCSTLNNVTYVSSEPVHKTITDGIVEVPVMEGEYKEKKVTMEDFLKNRTLLGNVSRRIYFGANNVADGSVEIYQDGEIWQEVEDAYLKYEGGRYFSIHKDYNGDVYLLMPVDFLDLIEQTPSGGITIKYVLTNGSAGIVPNGYIDSIADNRATQEGIWAPDMLTISNLTPTYGAYDEPDLERLKILGRLNAKMMDRFITLEDYEIATKTEPYVRQCVVADWKTLDLVQEPYVVKIWAVDWAGNTLGELDKRSLKKKLEGKGVSTVRVFVIDTDVITFDISVKLVLRTTSITEIQKISEQVRDELTRQYALGNMSYGGHISLSILHSRVKVISPYIRDVLVVSPTQDIEVSPIQFPKLNKVTVEVVEKLE